MNKLTDVGIRAVLEKPRNGRVELPDGAVPGLTLRIGKTRGATWSLMIRIAGEGGITDRGHALVGPKRRLTLGTYPHVSLHAARAKASAYLDQARRGESPVEALERAATGRLTVEGLAEKFLTDYVYLKQLRSAYNYEIAIRTHIVAEVGRVVADMLTRDQVRSLMKNAMVQVTPTGQAKARRRGGVEAARSVMGVLRKMINWGIRERLLKRVDNPVAGMQDNLPKKRKKERVLSLEEARIVWHAAGTLGYPFGPLYRLILLTGCRPGEWAQCRQSYIDLKHSLLVIPAQAYKSDHVHVVPLVPVAVQILEYTLTNYAGRQGDYVFSGTDGLAPVSGWTKGHSRMMRAVTAVSGERDVVPWTPHDLRRTVATRIAEQLGVGGEQLIKRVLGHADGSVTAIYNRYGYVKEMREVLERWAEDLMGGEFDPASIFSEPETVPYVIVEETSVS
ncbi:tyrosine-type recombinase/integrase [Peristeroidobacter agariperforans]|uniref:tyrosine-type recombinase/integrase n=1 Tax=Peristeroidobacter agariperforans TaxID=268404 RepID=UPI00101C3A8D|nr:tyrosine-type recombinase/integrase [Peristeroidobacter agariperforans]